jgi:hypothetical protein
MIKGHSCVTSGDTSMKESDLRAWHRNLGIILSLFIILQTVTDLLISLSEAGVPHTHANSESVVQANTHGEVKSKWSASIAFIHHGAGAIGMFYRILLGIGMLGMAVSGSMIFFKVRAHSKKY